MKVVHAGTGNTAVVKADASQWKELGREAEATGELDRAAAIYETAIRTGKKNLPAYHRLMLVYRKQKAYAKELKVINAAIAAYSELYAARLPGHNRKVIEISAKLNKAFGLVDRKGQLLHEPEPLATLQKRKALVAKRIK
jgi:tetratricopeptide (TPR) repeat protein